MLTSRESFSIPTFAARQQTSTLSVEVRRRFDESVCVAVEKLVDCFHVELFGIGER